MNQTICSFAGCEKKKRARGLCNEHYCSARRAGKIPARQTPEGRFWDKVDKTETCWNWVGAKNADGYGRFGLNGKIPMAHRVSYEWANGAIPVGMLIDHTCHNPSCVRPEHLRVVTHKQNMENVSGATPRSKSGVRGVWWQSDMKKWAVGVVHNGRKVHGGSFDTIAEAEAAAITKRLELFTHSDGR